MNQRRDKEWVAYVGMFQFPDGDAAARRVLGISQSLALSNLDVVIVAGKNSVSHDVLPLRSLKGIFYQGVDEYDSRWSKLHKISQTLWKAGQNTVCWLQGQPKRPRAVICYGSFLPFIYRLLLWCQTNRIPLVFDAVEWYDGKHMMGGPLGPFALSNEYTLRKLVPQCQGVIGISKYLCDYYRKRECSVVHIPPTLDVSQIQPRLKRENAGGRIQLVYTGVPGKKDLLGNILNALREVDFKGEHFHFRILGPSEEQVRRLYPGYLRKSTDIPGRLSHSKVLQVVRDADFSVLLRPNERYANAGFPTKVVESLSCGTPVICNLTSDLGDYIHDRIEGMVCADYSVESFGAALKAVTSLSSEKMSAMRVAARTQCEHSFNSRSYVNSLRCFLGEITK